MDILIAKDVTQKLFPNNYEIGWLKQDNEQMLWIRWGSAPSYEKAVECANNIIKERGYRKIYVSSTALEPMKVIDKVELTLIN